MERLGKSLFDLKFYLSGLINECVAQNNRTRESSVAISPQWSMLEEIEFHRLAKLRLEVDPPEDLCVHIGVIPVDVETDFTSSPQGLVRTIVRVRQVLRSHHDKN